MPDLPTYKRFPGTTGMDNSAVVRSSTPIPPRDMPLKGLKKLLCPPASVSDILPGSFAGAATSGAASRIKKTMFWLIVLPLAVIVFLFISVLFFALLTGF